jgi:hypothetical protein
LIEEKLKLLLTLGAGNIFWAHVDGAQLKELNQDEWFNGHALAGACDSVAERFGNVCKEGCVKLENLKKINLDYNRRGV